jgi:hypothetical protein
LGYSGHHEEQVERAAKSPGLAKENFSPFLLNPSLVWNKQTAREANKP